LNNIKISELGPVQEDDASFCTCMSDTLFTAVWANKILLVNVSLGASSSINSDAV